MASPRPFALVRTFDQWFRSVHDNTWLDSAEAVVSLAAEPDPSTEVGGGAPLGGLAFDCECRLYHSLPSEGRVEWQLWSPDLGVAGGAAMPAPLELLGSAAEPPPPPGEFAPAPDPEAPGLRQPRGLAVDERDRLYVCESGAARVLVYDLWSRRLLRRVGFAGARPLDAAAAVHGVFVVTAEVDALWKLDGRKPPVRVEVEDLAGEPALAGASRVAVSPDGIPFVLCRPTSGQRRVIALDPAARNAARRIVPAVVPIAADDLAAAADIEFDGEGALVLAQDSGDQLLRWRPTEAGGWEELPALKARHYDGGGIVRAPDGRIGFWSARGFRHAVAARLRYPRGGSVTTYRLDSGTYQSVWGRLFIDACIPEGTEVRVRCITADEPPEGETIPWQRPENQTAPPPERPELSPLLPVDVQDNSPSHPLHRRETGREIPWVEQPPGDHFETYEAPVLAAPGRFMWVILELSGNLRRTPRIRSLRIEHTAHDWLRRIPKTFSREEAVASFLRRFLHLPEGVIGELEGRSARRNALVNPAATPKELLPWLASFCGLVLDERWTAKQRRTLIAEVVQLFRLRGTVWGLRRFLEICLEAPIIILEHFKLRGYGGPIVGSAVPGQESRGVLGSGFRLGGALEDQPATGDTGTAAAFEKRAHRFTVIVAARLSAEQFAVADYILQVHRPAHTVYDICTVDAGMRVGRGLLVGMTAIIGPGEGWRTAQLGFTLGRGDALVGRPEAGTTLGASRLGQDTRVG